MVKKELVSIITPCFNGEKFVHRLLDSILNQTYPNIELIFINDGSIDKTEQVVLSYKNKFSTRGYRLHYITQRNSGQAYAINQGLKVFKGKYLTWPDSDDFLDAYSIADRVTFLEDNMQYGFVRSDAYIIDENNMKTSIGYLSSKKKDRFRENLFDDFINENNIYFAPCCYLVRTSSFLEVNPEKTIYVSEYDSSQNYQMYLPLAAKFKCGYIDKPLCSYLQRRSSHSHAFIMKDHILERFKGHEDIINNTLASLDINHDHYYNIVHRKYLRKKLILAEKYCDKQLAADTYYQLRITGKILMKDKILYLMSLSKAFKTAVKNIKRVKNTLQRYVYALQIFDRNDIQ